MMRRMAFAVLSVSLLIGVAMPLRGGARLGGEFDGLPALAGSALAEEVGKCAQGRDNVVTTTSCTKAANDCQQKMCGQVTCGCMNPLLGNTRCVTQNQPVANTGVSPGDCVYGSPAQCPGTYTEFPCSSDAQGVCTAGAGTGPLSCGTMSACYLCPPRG